jgi:hypothetical protein
MSTKNGFIVMVGVDDDGKARAARYEEKDAAAVHQAARVMDFRVGSAKSKQTAELVDTLPIGKLFESGKGLVPLVREDVFYKLSELLTFDELWTRRGVVDNARGNPAASLVKTADDLWSTISVGSTVLCYDRSFAGEPCWCAAIVTAARNGNTLTVRWRDYPGFKPFTVERRAVALLRPDVCA